MKSKCFRDISVNCLSLLTGSRFLCFRSRPSEFDRRTHRLQRGICIAHGPVSGHCRGGKEARPGSVQDRNRRVRWLSEINFSNENISFLIELKIPFEHIICGCHLENYVSHHSIVYPKILEVSHFTALIFWKLFVDWIQGYFSFPSEESAQSSKMRSRKKHKQEVQNCMKLQNTTCPHLNDSFRSKILSGFHFLN